MTQEGKMMTTRTRAGTALTAGLVLFALSGPLLADPPTYQGSAPGTSYGAAPDAAPGNVTPAGYATTSAPAGGGCATCSTPAAGSNHPGHKVHCPPPFYHVYEGPPCLKFKKGCPRPVCDPCELPHFGYYQTCWSPWPYPRDFRHCPYPTPSDVLPSPQYPPFTPKQYGDPDAGTKGESQKTDGSKKPGGDDDGRPSTKPEQLGPPDKLDKSPEKSEKETTSQNTNVILHESKVRLVPQD
jgi:hypothetical protein